MDLNATRVFVGVAQAGSLSAAAVRMDMPLPTLSRQIRELERALGVQLLERSTRGTRLTDAGARLYEQVSPGIEMLADAARTIRDDQASLRGRLRLSLPTGFAPWWALLDAFRHAYPDIRLSVYATDRRVDHVQDGIDVALRIGAVMHEDMVARRLLAYRHVLVAAPALIARLGMPESPEALRGYPCASWCREANVEAVWQLGAVSVAPDAVLSTNDYLQLRDHALAGEVVTELPPFLAAEALRDGRLCAVLPAYLLPEQQINLLYVRHRHPSSIVRAYLDFCQKHVARFLAMEAR